MQLTRAAVQITRVITIFAMIAGCTLPRSGPTANEILDGRKDAGGNLHIVDVSPSVAAASRSDIVLGFSEKFRNASLLSPDVISAGDRLSVVVWENVENGLLAGVGTKVTPVDQIQVDQSGKIFMPYVGQIQAAGRTPENMRQEITKHLSNQTPDPQVEVRRVAGDGSTVSVLGDVMKPGVYPIDTPTRRLSSMLARAGGVNVVPDVAQVKLERRGSSERIWLQDLYDNPDYDIALRSGDRIVVEKDRRYFTALGATEGQARIAFTKRDMSALEAVAVSGGLDGSSADPTGIFVFRAENSDVANRVTGRADLAGPQRVAYVMDLTEAEGMFAAREFVIRDEDTVYITEAPFSSWGRVIALTATVVALAGSVAAIAN